MARLEYTKSLGRRLLGSLVLGLTVALVVGLVLVFIVGRPPHRFRIASGAAGGAYVAFAQALRDTLATEGFTVDVIETAGSVENVALLKSGDADVGIVQSGTDDAVRYFKDGPTALEQFLPFDIASPLSRWWVLILPLIVLLFPLVAIVRAVWSWFNTSRIVSWYPRLHWIEQNLDSFSTEQLDAQLVFLKDLDSSLPTRTRVSAGYLAAYYDMRTTVRFVSGRVAARHDELRDMEAAGAAPMPDFDQNPPETPDLRHTPTDAHSPG